MDWSQLGDAASRIITALGAALVAWLTARQATKTRRVEAQAQVTETATEGRLAIEDKAYARAESYWQNALRDARREVDETRQELAEERRERREEHDMLNGQMTAQREQHTREMRELREHHSREMTELRAQMHGATVRAERAEQAARSIARRANQPEPDL